MRRLIIAAVAAIVSILPSQAGIDYAAMNTPGRASLLERFIGGDSTLTVGEVSAVYYGAVHDPSFVAGGRDYAAINTLRAERRYGEMLPLCLDALKSDPASLTLLFRTFAGAFNNPAGRDNELLNRTRTQVNQVCDAIFASGTGVTDDSPFEVVADGDIEQFLTNYLQVESILDTASQGNLTVKSVRLPGAADPVYLYFRVYRP